MKAVIDEVFDTQHTICVVEFGENRPFLNARTFDKLHQSWKKNLQKPSHFFQPFQLWEQLTSARFALLKHNFYKIHLLMGGGGLIFYQSTPMPPGGEGGIGGGHFALSFVSHMFPSEPLIQPPWMDPLVI